LDAEQARVTAWKPPTNSHNCATTTAFKPLDVLDVERGLLDAELNRIEAQRAQLAATADLFKALGGGWDGVLEVEKSAKAN